jgi:hypothetical protein
MIDALAWLTARCQPAFATAEGTTETTLSQWRTRVYPDDLPKFDELKKQIFDNRRDDYKFDY